jgi:hypothetical protein
MRGKLGTWMGTVAAASAVVLLMAGCAPQSSAKADIDPADGNWYQVGVDFTSEYYAVYAYGNTNTGEDPYIAIRIDRDGAVEQLQATGSTDSYDNFLWYSVSEKSRMPTQIDPGQVVFQGNSVRVSGQAFQYSDFDYATPISYEIRLTCDSQG